MLIHGSGGNHAHWPLSLCSFSGANIYAIDLPGHGRSGGYGRKSVDAYADFMDSFVQKLELVNVTLFGHSLGGAIALIAALRQPEWLDKIVLVGTGARLRVARSILDGLLSDFELTVNYICELSFGPSASKLLVKNAREDFLKTNPKITHGDFSACDQFDIMNEIENISYPTLVISGTEDKLTPVKYGEYLYNHIQEAKIHIIKDGGHMMALEKTEEFMTGIADYLGTKRPQSKVLTCRKV